MFAEYKMSSGFIGANVLNEDLIGCSNLATQVATNTADIATLNEQLQTLQGKILIPNDTSILVGNAPQPTKITGTSMKVVASPRNSNPHSGGFPMEFKSPYSGNSSWR